MKRARNKLQGLLQRLISVGFTWLEQNIPSSTCTALYLNSAPPTLPACMHWSSLSSTFPTILCLLERGARWLGFLWSFLEFGAIDCCKSIGCGLCLDAI